MERIQVVTTEYEFSHGHAPRGRGYWAFRLGSPNAEPVFIKGTLTYGEAKKEAVRLAREQGVETVRVCS